MAPQVAQQLTTLSGGIGDVLVEMVSPPPATNVLIIIIIIIIINNNIINIINIIMLIPIPTLLAHGQGESLVIAQSATSLWQINAFNILEDGASMALPTRKPVGR
jgi:hypothetical protein